MNKNRPQYEAMLEHFLLCFNDIVVCRKVDVPSLKKLEVQFFLNSEKLSKKRIEISNN